MSSHKIQHINLPLLKQHLLTKVSTSCNTITIYHIIVGSKVYSLSSDVQRNHECPQVVKNLLFNPDLQLSLSVLSNIDIIIRQVLILIDPAYARDPKPDGLLSVIDWLPLDLTIDHQLEYIKVKSILEPIIVPDDITEDHIKELVQCLDIFRTNFPIVINIMDCSSNTCHNLYANNIDTIYNWIHITKPNCLLDDTEKIYTPMITQDNSGCNSGCNSGVNTRVTSLFKYDKLAIRWVNCNDDLRIINNSISPAMLRNCIYSRNYYDIVVRLYKVKNTEYLFQINKLWGITTYTTNFTFSATGAAGSSKEIEFNFKILSFEEFAKYWKYKGFRELFPFSQGYDYILLCQFINYFIEKYSTKIGLSFLGLNPSIVDFLKFEAFEMMSSLVNYFPDDIKYVSSSCETISRESIKHYLVDNECIL